MLRIGRLPAFVIPESRFAMRVAFGAQTLLAHGVRDRLHLGVKLLDAGGQFFQMQMSLIVDHLCLMEYAAHVALELFVLVDFAVAELFDRICWCQMDREFRTNAIFLISCHTPSVTPSF